VLLSMTHSRYAEKKYKDEVAREKEDEKKKKGIPDKKDM
jgi:hypothetical protein